jgi:uncharacterized membrane protein
MGEIIKKVTKVEFSKKLTIWILIVFAILVFGGTALMAFVNASIGTSFVALVGVVMPIPTTAVYSYYKKAKEENKLKIDKSYSNINNTDNQVGDA